MNQSTKTWKKLLSALFLSTLFFCNISHAQQYWGALSMDTNTGIAGGNYNSRTKAQAIRNAQTSCVNKHKGRSNNCEFMVSFANSCVAVYWSPVNKKFGWATNDLYSNRAEKAAYNACVKRGGKECQLRLSFCTDRIVY